jgi:hypothetical protein
MLRALRRKRAEPEGRGEVGEHGGRLRDEVGTGFRERARADRSAGDAAGEVVGARMEGGA